MIAKIKMKFSTKVLALALLAGIVAHVVLYGTVAFNDDQHPSTISNIFAGLVLAVLVVMLYLILSTGEPVAQPNLDNERS